MTKLLDGYISRKELAAQLGISERTVCRYADDRDGLPSLIIGGRRMYRLEAVRQWLARRERQPNPSRRAA